jgi:hypothetical protein
MEQYDQEIWQITCNEMNIFYDASENYPSHLNLPLSVEYKMYCMPTYPIFPNKVCVMGNREML